MKMQSLFGRAQYDYLGRYLLNASRPSRWLLALRRANRLGHVLLRVGRLGLSREAVHESFRFVDDLTLRVGYGTTGNSSIGDFDVADAVRRR